MYQKLIIIGNLGKDPEMRYTPDGKAITTLSVATSRKAKGADETTWFRVTVFGQQAEACNQYIKKGARVLVEGRLQPDKESGGPKVYERKDGTWGASYEVTASDVEFVGNKKGEVAPDIDVAF